MTVLYRPEFGPPDLGDVMEQMKIYPESDHGVQTFGMVEESNPQLLFRLASAFITLHEHKDPSTLIDSSIAFGMQVLESMAMHGVSNFTNAGTSQQYAGAECYAPLNLYAATKQVFQDIRKCDVAAYGLQAITLQLYDTYGQHDRSPRSFSLLVQATRDGKVPKLHRGWRENSTMLAVCLSQQRQN